MTNDSWWSDAVVYQVYLRSFADGDGDGVGDLAGLRARLGHLVDLGVDALWLNPCYVSPQRDHGYDIADYFAIDPTYGTTDDLVDLVAEAHRLGLRVLLDLVPNHCSTEHPWFREALAAPVGSPQRGRFVIRDGRGPDGALPPNNWQSVFGGPAWTRLADGQWYLHSFDASQPDFNWRDASVRAYFEDVLRFWFGLGVDGFRIDVAHGLVVAEHLPDLPTDGAVDRHPMWDQPEVHEIYRTWRRIAQEYRPDPKYFIGELWVDGTERLRPYLAPDELHQAFCFDLLVQPWDADRLAGAVRSGLATADDLGAPAAWTLNNHDVHRVVSRYGQVQDLSAPDPQDLLAAARRTGPVDLAVGAARARAAVMLLLALPGSVYLYQGEELGLPEVLDLPDDVRQDPIWVRSGGRELGRDGCRVPLPWRADAPRLGFSDPTGAAPWLPTPDWFAGYAVDRQARDDGSFLALYRRLVRGRREVFAPGAPLRWVDHPDPDVLAFTRGAGLCLVNVGGDDLPLAPALEQAIVARSGAAGGLVRDSAVWIDTARVPGGLRSVAWDVPSGAGAPARA